MRTPVFGQTQMADKAQESEDNVRSNESEEARGEMPWEQDPDEDFPEILSDPDIVSDPESDPEDLDLEELSRVTQDWEESIPPEEPEPEEPALVEDLQTIPLESLRWEGSGPLMGDALTLFYFLRRFKTAPDLLAWLDKSPGVSRIGDPGKGPNALVLNGMFPTRELSLMAFRPTAEPHYQRLVLSVPRDPLASLRGDIVPTARDSVSRLP